MKPVRVTEYFGALHTRIATLYSCGCQDCQKQLLLSTPPPSEGAGGRLLSTGLNAFKRLHEKGSYKPEDLQTEKAYRELATKTADIFDFAVTNNDMPEVMRTALQNDVYLFSGLKTHAQLLEASRLLLDDKGDLKPFSTFANDFKKINTDYNQTYLNTEYEYAVNAAQMAAKWTEFSDSDRYYLQYRTAGDNRVRDTHAKLHGTTLPKSDPFWDFYYAPNGWNCRCTVVEVLKDKYPLSDSDKAIAAGDEATTQIGKSGKNQLEIFRFNPGKQKVIFPPEHPYSKVVGAKKVIETLKKEGKSTVSEIAKQNQAIYNKPVTEQFSTIYNHKSGGRVEVHELVNLYAEDYKDVNAAAKAFAKDGKIVKILPEIDYTEKEARAKILVGLTVERANPDLLVGNEYVDVKRPSSIRNITGNANKASKQGATALISDVKLDKILTDELIDVRANAILSKLNNSNYVSDKVYFLRNGKIISKNTTASK